MTLEHQKWLGDQISRLDSSWIMRNLQKYLDHWMYIFGLWWGPKLRFKLSILVGRLKITGSQISCPRFIMNFENYVRNGEPLNVAESNGWDSHVPCAQPTFFNFLFVWGL